MTLAGGKCLGPPGISVVLMSMDSLTSGRGIHHLEQHVAADRFNQAVPARKGRVRSRTFLWWRNMECRSRHRSLTR